MRLPFMGLYSPPFPNSCLGKGGPSLYFPLSSITMSTCKKCGEPVTWERSGKSWRCLNPDGSDHWDLCSKVRTMRQIEAGEHFVNRRGEGYATSRRRMYTRISSGVRTGRDFTGACDCTTPPWEQCPHSTREV